MTEVIIDIRVVAMSIMAPLNSAEEREVQWAKLPEEVQQWFFQCARSAVGIVLIAVREAETRSLDS